MVGPVKHTTWVQGWGEMGQAAQGVLPWHESQRNTSAHPQTQLAEDWSRSAAQHSTAPGCRAGEKWDKQHGVGVERAELVTRTRDAVARGQQLGHVWHAATHIEHARPMLQVIQP